METIKILLVINLVLLIIGIVIIINVSRIRRNKWIEFMVEKINQGIIN